MAADRDAEGLASWDDRLRIRLISLGQSFWGRIERDLNSAESARRSSDCRLETVGARSLRHGSLGHLHVFGLASLHGARPSDLLCPLHRLSVRLEC